MPPKRMQTDAVPHLTHAATQRTPQVQTSGIFKLPVEILFEIFSYFNDHRHFIRRTHNSRPIAALMEREHVERSTAIRKLTMACWAMRDTLLPVLWKDVEGCVVSHSRRGHTYGLYDQCVYLLRNPTIAAYVQALSVDLRFKDAPKDLMKKFIETLVRLPNLRTLELLSVSHRSPVTAGLKRKCAKFPNIREMTVDDTYPDFIRSCPNLGGLTFRYGLGSSACTALESYGAGLKRIAGVNVDLDTSFVTRSMVESCPKLQEIGLFGVLGFSPSRSEQICKHLRRAEHLSVIEFDLVEDLSSQFGHSPSILEEKMNVWKRGFADVLRDSPSKARKFLRWRVVQAEIFAAPQGYNIVENGELEVFPRTSL